MKTGYEQWKTHKASFGKTSKYNYYHGYVKFFQKDIQIVNDMVVGYNLKERDGEEVEKLSPQAQKS